MLRAAGRRIRAGYPNIYTPLRSHLKKRDPKQSRAVMEEVKKLSCPDQVVGEIANLSKMVGRYKFKEAGELADKIINILG